MEKSCHSSGDSISTATSSTGNSSNGRDQYLKSLNKLSHKISKPAIKKPVFDQHPPLVHHHPQPLQPSAQSNGNNGQAPQSNNNLHQPPVYNINKNDFRDVVQKLTGSPAHEHRQISPAPSPQQQPSAPLQPPVGHAKPQSSRLQRIRPPPLAQISNRPTSLLNCAAPPGLPNPGFVVPRPSAPLSPLPPLPPVHAAAESPVSAYLRYLQTGDSVAKSSLPGFSPLAPVLLSPRWYQTSPSLLSSPAPESGNSAPPPGFQSPPFGCLNSPRSSYPLLSPSLLLSPNSGQLAFPLSPTVPVPSPKFKGL